MHNATYEYSTGNEQVTGVMEITDNANVLTEQTQSTKAINIDPNLLYQARSVSMYVECLLYPV